MSLWEAVVLGVIQGLTEFLPISSTAHLLVARRLMGHEKPEDAFTTAIQLGTLVAVFLYFRADLWRTARAVLADFRGRRFGATPESRLFWMMVVGSVPVVACGLAFKDLIKGPLYRTWVIGLAAVVFSGLLLAAELVARARARRGAAERDDRQVTWGDAVLVGLFQALALIPGASRSGVTITAGLFAGLSRPAAARFSFLLSLPSLLGAGLKDAYDDRAAIFGTSADILNLAVGTAVAAVVGYLAIAWLIGFLKRYSTFSFIAYRLALAAVLFALLAAGRLGD